MSINVNISISIRKFCLYRFLLVLVFNWIYNLRKRILFDVYNNTMDFSAYTIYEGTQSGKWADVAQSIHPSSGSTAQIGPLPPPLRFLNHTELYTRQDSFGWLISPSQRPLPTQDNTTYKYKRQTSVPRAGCELAIPATKRPQIYALDRAATGIGGSSVTGRPGFEPLRRQLSQYLTSFSLMTMLPFDNS
jgi:hypothetical protein